MGHILKWSAEFLYCHILLGYGVDCRTGTKKTHLDNFKGNNFEGQTKYYVLTTNHAGFLTITLGEYLSAT